MSADEENPPSLGGTWQDAGTAVVKGGIGSIPIVGSLVGEIVGLIIPNQRLDRIEKYLGYLTEKLRDFDQNDLRKKFQDPEYVDLFEEGAAQSLRAVSDERKQYIAQLVANGITGDDKARIEAKRLLKLIQEIDDDQIIILASYLHRYRDDDAWHEKHADILESVGAYIGSSQDELDRDTVYELARSQLIQLGLIQANFGMLRKGEIPEFDDKTGMIKSSSRDLAPLGRLLLARIGIAQPDEF